MEVQVYEVKKQNHLASFAKKAAVGISAATTSVMVFAAEGAGIVDVTAVTSKIEGNESAMIGVGTAVLGLVVVGVLFSMVRRVLR